MTGWGAIYGWRFFFLQHLYHLKTDDFWNCQPLEVTSLESSNSFCISHVPGLCVSEVIGHPNHSLTIWLDAWGNFLQHLLLDGALKRECGTEVIQESPKDKKAMIGVTDQQHGCMLLSLLTFGQIIATSHDLTPNGSLVREIPLFQGNLGWWNIIIWPVTYYHQPRLQTFQ